MKFGINEKDNKTFCANCGVELTKEQIKTHNYCPTCGTGLKLDSINSLIKLERNIQKDLINQIEVSLKEHSIEQILSDFKDQLND